MTRRLRAARAAASSAARSKPRSRPPDQPTRWSHGRRASGTTALALALCLSCTAWAQVSPEREVELCRQSYELGKFADALQRARTSIGLPSFSPTQRAALHELAGLSSFNLGDVASARAHFLSLLQVDPDHQLDPFAVAPAAIKVFEQVRKENGPALELLRQQLAVRAEQERAQREAQERLEREAEERRSRLEELTRTVTVRTVERRSLFLNFLPFGVGQFQQGRVEWGVLFALSEAALAVTSVIAYFAIDALYQPYTITLPDRTLPGGLPYTATARRIPTGRMGEYRVWTAVKFGTGISFYAVWALGAGEALWHHRPEVVTETKERLVQPTGARIHLFPTRGGLGAGVTVGF